MAHPHHIPTVLIEEDVEVQATHRLEVVMIHLVEVEVVDEEAPVVEDQHGEVEVEHP